MSRVQVLLVAGTHGNELNASWLFDQWDQNENLVNTNGITLFRVIGNPEARKFCKRYIDRDLNRSFHKNLMQSKPLNDKEVRRANELLKTYGPLGENPCQIVFDFHSTTSGMGTCLVVYGRRPKDLALAALIQNRLGLSIYLHEGDPIQNGFLVESWPCGLVVEIGPVPQGLLNQRTILQTKITLETCLEELEKVSQCKEFFPDYIIIHKHLKNIDFPKNDKGEITFFIHRSLQNKDWLPLNYGDPLFENLQGDVITNLSKETVVPLFINEAAYVEKNISMAFTRRDVLNFDKSWGDELRDLVCS